MAYKRFGGQEYGGRTSSEYGTGGSSEGGKWESDIYMTWHPGLEKKTEFGFFSMPQESKNGELVLPHKPDSMWEETAIVYGQDPMADPSPAFKSYIARAIIFDWRTRKVMISPEGTRHYYQIRTSKDNMKGGPGWTFETNTQVMLTFPSYVDIETGEVIPIILSANRYIKGLSWDNPPGKYNKPQFDLGVSQWLVDYAEKHEVPICAFVADLRGVMNDKGRPYWIESKTKNTVIYNQPFNVDLGVAANKTEAKKTGWPTTRFVPEEMLEVLNDYNANVVGPWKAEWASTEAMNSRRSEDAGDAGDDEGFEFEDDVDSDDFPF